MQRILTVLVIALLSAALGWTASRAFGDGRSYADDRAEIEELFARYLFALDWQDPQMYGSVFAPDGVLVWAGGTVNGREAIVAELHNARAADQRAHDAEPDLRPFRRRHFVSNFALKIDGDRATARSLWFEFNNDGPDRKPYVGAYGHLEDELKKVDGKWLIARHQVFNEQREGMSAGDQNPAW